MPLKKLHVERRPIDLAAYKFRVAHEVDCYRRVTGPTLVYEGSELKIAYMELDERLPRVVEALRRIQYVRDWRTGGLPTNSRIIGYTPRAPLRKDFCASVSLASELPEEHRVICEAGAVADRYYTKANPGLYFQHNSLMKERVNPDWRIDESVFTSGIINKNNPLRYHFDTGNFQNVWSAMLVFKKDCEGGGLNVPEYDLHFKLNDHSLLMFDGQGLLHGVTPFKLRTDRGYRYSVVYYSLQQMWNCLPPDQELARIRHVKTRREVRRARR